MYVGHYTLPAESSSTGCTSKHYYKLSTSLLSGDPLIIVFDANTGKQIGSDDDSGSGFNSLLKISKNCSEQKKIKYIVLSYTKDTAGSAYLSLTKNYSLSSNNWVPRFYYRIKFGAMPIKTNWDEGDVIRATGSYKGLTFKETVIEASKKRQQNNLTSYNCNFEKRTCSNLNYKYVVRNDHKELCEYIGGDYEGVNAYSDLCEFASNSDNVTVFTINNWTKPYLKSTWFFGRKYSYTYTPKQEILEEDNLNWSDENFNNSRYSFRMRLNKQSGSSSAIVIGLDPLTTSSYISSNNVRIYKDRIIEGDSLYNDNDGDGISNELERKIGIDPSLVDTDDDAIMDSHELFGHEICLQLTRYSNYRYCFSGIPFHNKGADPNTHDVFLEIDYMQDKSVGSSIFVSKPSDEMLRSLSQIMQNDTRTAFNKRLHIELDQAIPYRQVIDFHAKTSSHASQGVDTTEGTYFLYDYINLQNVSYYDFDDVKAKYLNPIKKIFYHYMVLGHNIWDRHNRQKYEISGRAEIIGNDSIVAIPFEIRNGNDVYFDRERVGFVLHELGHNFGLLHNGNRSVSDEAGDRDKFMSKIHKSVMNYRYTQFGINGNRDADTLNEMWGTHYNYSYAKRADFDYNTINIFQLEEQDIVNYHLQNGTTDEYEGGQGIFDIKGLCSSVPTDKKWNDQVDCDSQAGNTCDCDIQEWQNLWVDFRFDWDNRPDPDVQYTERYLDSKSIYDYLNDYHNEILTKRTKKKSLYFEKPNLYGEYYFSYSYDSDSPYRLLADE